MIDAAFFAALFEIIIINLVLSGDNAIVIALASRNLPTAQKKKAIIYGTLGAILLRILLTFVVVWVLRIPLLMVVGGALLMWIAFKLLADKDDKVDVKAGANLWQAVQTIIVADLVMSLDNVLAVAAAASGHYLLLILGIALSIPIIVFGSTVILKLMERYRAIIYIGAAILGWTAGEMIIGDRYIAPYVHDIPGIHYIVPLLAAVAVLAAGYQAQKRGGKSVNEKEISNTP